MIQNKIIKAFLILCGTTSLLLGIIGIFLPGLPTTPFLLLSAYCFSKSSEKLHHWLLNHKWFGEYIRDFQSGKGIRMKHKLTAIFFIWVTIPTTALYFTPLIHVKILLFVIAIGVTSYLLYLPTRKV